MHTNFSINFHFDAHQLSVYIMIFSYNYSVLSS